MPAPDCVIVPAPNVVLADAHTNAGLLHLTVWTRCLRMSLRNSSSTTLSRLLSGLRGFSRLHTPSEPIATSLTEVIQIPTSLSDLWLTTALQRGGFIGCAETLLSNK